MSTPLRKNPRRLASQVSKPVSSSPQFLNVSSPNDCSENTSSTNLTAHAFISDTAQQFNSSSTGRRTPQGGFLDVPQDGNYRDPAVVEPAHAHHAEGSSAYTSPGSTASPTSKTPTMSNPAPPTRHMGQPQRMQSTSRLAKTATCPSEIPEHERNAAAKTSVSPTNAPRQPGLDGIAHTTGNSNLGHMTSVRLSEGTACIDYNAQCGTLAIGCTRQVHVVQVVTPSKSAAEGNISIPAAATPESKNFGLKVCGIFGNISKVECVAWCPNSREATLAFVQLGKNITVLFDVLVPKGDSYITQQWTQKTTRGQVSVVESTEQPSSPQPFSTSAVTGTEADLDRNLYRFGLKRSDIKSRKAKVDRENASRSQLNVDNTAALSSINHAPGPNSSISSSSPPGPQALQTVPLHAYHGSPSNADLQSNAELARTRTNSMSSTHVLPSNWFTPVQSPHPTQYNEMWGTESQASMNSYGGFPLASAMQSMCVATIDTTFRKVEKIVWDPHTPYTLALFHHDYHFELWTFPVATSCTNDNENYVFRRTVSAPKKSLRPATPRRGSVTRDLAFSPHDPNLIVVATEVASVGSIWLYDRRYPDTPRTLKTSGPCQVVSFHPDFSDLLVACYRKEKIKMDSCVHFFRVWRPDAHQTAPPPLPHASREGPQLQSDNHGEDGTTGVPYMESQSLIPVVECSAPITHLRWRPSEVPHATAAATGSVSAASTGKSAADPHAKPSTALTSAASAQKRSGESIVSKCITNRGCAGEQTVRSILSKLWFAVNNDHDVLVWDALVSYSPVYAVKGVHGGKGIQNKGDIADLVWINSVTFASVAKSNDVVLTSMFNQGNNDIPSLFSSAASTSLNQSDIFSLYSILPTSSVVLDLFGKGYIVQNCNLLKDYYSEVILDDVKTLASKFLEEPADVYKSSAEGEAAEEPQQSRRSPGSRGARCDSVLQSQGENSISPIQHLSPVESSAGSTNAPKEPASTSTSSAQRRPATTTTTTSSAEGTSAATTAATGTSKPSASSLLPSTAVTLRAEKGATATLSVSPPSPNSHGLTWAAALGGNARERSPSAQRGFFKKFKHFLTSNPEKEKNSTKAPEVQSQSANGVAGRTSRGLPSERGSGTTSTAPSQHVKNLGSSTTQSTAAASRSRSTMDEQQKLPGGPRPSATPHSAALPAERSKHSLSRDDIAGSAKTANEEAELPRPVKTTAHDSGRHDKVERELRDDVKVCLPSDGEMSGTLLFSFLHSLVAQRDAQLSILHGEIHGEAQGDQGSGATPSTLHPLLPPTIEGAKAHSRIKIPDAGTNAGSENVDGVGLPKSPYGASLPASTRNLGDTSHPSIARFNGNPTVQRTIPRNETLPYIPDGIGAAADVDAARKGSKRGAVGNSVTSVLGKETSKMTGAGSLPSHDEATTHPSSQMGAASQVSGDLKLTSLFNSVHPHIDVISLVATDECFSYVDQQTQEAFSCFAMRWELGYDVALQLKEILDSEASHITSIGNRATVDAQFAAIMERNASVSAQFSMEQEAKEEAARLATYKEATWIGRVTSNCRKIEATPQDRSSPPLNSENSKKGAKGTPGENSIPAESISVHGATLHIPETVPTTESSSGPQSGSPTAASAHVAHSFPLTQSTTHHPSHPMRPLPDFCTPSSTQAAVQDSSPSHIPSRHRRAQNSPLEDMWRTIANALRTHNVDLIVVTTASLLEYGSLVGDTQFCIVLYVTFCLWWRFRFACMWCNPCPFLLFKQSRDVVYESLASTLTGASPGNTAANGGSTFQTSRALRPSQWKQRALQWLDSYTIKLTALELYVPLNELLLVFPVLTQDATNAVQPRACDLAYEKKHSSVFCGSCTQSILASSSESRNLSKKTTKFCSEEFLTNSAGVPVPTPIPTSEVASPLMRAQVSGPSSPNGNQISFNPSSPYTIKPADQLARSRSPSNGGDTQVPKALKLPTPIQTRVSDDAALMQVPSMQLGTSEASAKRNANGASQRSSGTPGGSKWYWESPQASGEISTFRFSPSSADPGKNYSDVDSLVGGQQVVSFELPKAIGGSAYSLAGSGNAEKSSAPRKCDEGRTLGYPLDRTNSIVSPDSAMTAADSGGGEGDLSVLLEHVFTSVVKKANDAADAGGTAKLNNATPAEHRAQRQAALDILNKKLREVIFTGFSESESDSDDDLFSSMASTTTGVSPASSPSYSSVDDDQPWLNGDATEHISDDSTAAHTEQHALDMRIPGTAKKARNRTAKSRGPGARRAAAAARNAGKTSYRTGRNVSPGRRIRALPDQNAVNNAASAASLFLVSLPNLSRKSTYGCGGGGRKRREGAYRSTDSPRPVICGQSQYVVSTAMVATETADLEETHNATCLCCRAERAMTCVICEQIVEGTFYWLRPCGHGGHIEHIEEWLRYESACPKCGASLLP